MHLKSLLILSVFLTMHCFELESVEICLKSSNEKCSKTHHYSCGKHHCAYSKQVCDAFVNFSISSRKIKNSIRDQIRLIKYQSFLKNMKKCASVSYVLKSEDICLNNKMCMIRKRIPLRTGESYIFLKNLCKCEGNLSHSCATKYCTVNHEACKHLTTKLEKSVNVTDISRCKD